MIEVRSLRRLFAMSRFRTHNEAALQEGIAKLFADHGLDFVREKRLSPEDRVDFFLDGIAIEVKIKGSLSEVTRQLHRYSELPAVSAIVLVTTRMQHCAMPATMSGKPVDVIHLIGSVL